MIPGASYPDGDWIRHGNLTLVVYEVGSFVAVRREVGEVMAEVAANDLPLDELLKVAADLRYNARWDVSKRLRDGIGQ